MSQSAESAHIRALTVEAVEAATELIGRPVVGLRWNEPSALDGMTVGALAAHLVRAAGAVVAYLDRTDASQRPEDDLLNPVTYFHAALDAPIHDQIKTVSADEANLGHGATVRKSAALVVALRDRLATEPDDRLVGALGGRMLSLDDFCRTRLIEVLTHIDDLAVSVGEQRPPTDPESIGIVIEILTGIASNLHGDWTVLHALSRAERLTAPVFPVF